MTKHQEIGRTGIRTLITDEVTHLFTIGWTDGAGNDWVSLQVGTDADEAMDALVAAIRANLHDVAHDARYVITDETTGTVVFTTRIID